MASAPNVTFDSPISVVELLQQLMVQVSEMDSKFESRMSLLENSRSGSPTEIQGGNGHLLRQSPRAETPTPRGRYHRMDYPLFDGSGIAEDWLMKMEKLLIYNQIVEEDWVMIADLQLSGDAEHWLSSYTEDRETALTWREFKAGVRSRFDEDPLRDYEEELYKLTQQGSVSEYARSFDYLSTRVPGLRKKSLISCFIGGLRKEIRLNVKSYRPTSLSLAISLAKIQEARDAELMKTMRFHPQINPAAARHNIETGVKCPALTRLSAAEEQRR